MRQILFYFYFDSKRKPEHIFTHIMEIFYRALTNMTIRGNVGSVGLGVIPWMQEPNGYWQPLVFDFEKVLSDRIYVNAYMNFMAQWWWMSIIFTIIYLLLIYYGRQFMETRKPYELRRSLMIWNVFLVVFSVFGTIRCLPPLIYSLRYESFESTICDAKMLYSVNGFW